MTTESVLCMCFGYVPIFIGGGEGLRVEQRGPVRGVQDHSPPRLLPSVWHLQVLRDPFRFAWTDHLMHRLRDHRSAWTHGPTAAIDPWGS